MEDNPGYFESNIPEYPGHFSLPNPFLDRHMRAWWDKAITPLKGMTDLDYERYDAEWEGVVELITQFGEWHVEGVPVGDLDSDGVPMVVKNWAMKEASDYIAPFLPLRIRLRLFGIE